MLGCWRSLLLPLSLDAELSKQARHLCRSLSAKGVEVDEDVLKVCLSLLFSFEREGWSHMLHSVKPVTRLRSLCCQHRLSSLKKICQVLPWEFLHSGTLGVTISFTQLWPSSQTERSPAAMLFSSWTRFVSKIVLYRLHPPGPSVEKSCLVSSAVPSEAAVGEHAHPEVSLSQPDAVPALTHRPVRSKRGRTAVGPEEGCGCEAGVLRARP